MKKLSLFLESPSDLCGWIVRHSLSLLMNITDKYKSLDAYQLCANFTCWLVTCEPLHLHVDLPFNLVHLHLHLVLK